MESILNRARENFPLDEPIITLGFSNFLITVMATFYLSFGILAFSDQHVGTQMVCYDEPENIRSICQSRFEYLPVGPHFAEKYHKREIALSRAYYKYLSPMLIFIGILLSVLTYMWKRWESGYISRIVKGRNLAVPGPAESQKLASDIAFVIEDFAHHCGSYFNWYVTSELLNFGTCVLVSAYITVVHHPHVLQESLPGFHEMFPKEVTCLYNITGASGYEQQLEARCLIANQRYVEFFHTVLAYVNWFVAALLILNFVYILCNLFGITSKISGQKNKSFFFTLSLNQKLLCLLLANNFYGKNFHEGLTMVRERSNDTNELEMVSVVSD